MGTIEKVKMVEVTSRHEGQRVDNFLMRELKGVPRSRVYRLIRRGEVRINRKRCKPETKLACGDIVRIPPFSGASVKEPGKITPSLKKFLLASVIHENEDLLVINKPAGLAVHGGSGIKLGLIEALRQIEPRWQQAELAHRLDRDTSGCLVIAKTADGLRSLHQDFKERRVHKTYQALVYGQWPAEVDAVDAKLHRTQLESGERLVRVSENGKESRTTFSVLTQYAKGALIQAKPETGRTHQIRVHCQFAGHPIIGDDRYTNKQLMEQYPALARIKGLCLHAAQLEFKLPGTEEYLQVSADIGQNLKLALEVLKE